MKICNKCKIIKSFNEFTKDKNKKDKLCTICRWHSALEYTMCELKRHLESKFTKGMSWNNYGKNGWHIDHIIPHSYFKYNSTKHPAFKECWALSNLQPLWATTEIAMIYGESDNYIGNLNKLNKVILTKDIEELLNRVNVISI